MNNYQVLPAKPQPLLDAIGQIAPRMQQQEQFDSAQAATKSANAEEQRFKINEMYAKALMAITDPAKRKQAYDQAPPEVKAAMPDPGAPPPKTPDQLANDQAAGFDIRAMSAADPTVPGVPGADTPGASMLPPSSSKMNAPSPMAAPLTGESSAPPEPAGAGGQVAPINAPTVKQQLDGWFAQYVRNNKRAPSKEEIASKTTELTAGEQGLTDASAIDDKRALNAHETQIDLPKVQPEIDEKKASAFEKRASGSKSYAEIPKIKAETGKINEETTGLKNTNALMGGVAGVAPAGGPAVPIEKAPAIVRMLAETTYDPMLLRKFKPEEQAALLEAASKYNPKLNLQDYPEQFKIKADFASGAAKKNVQALNTAIGHTYDMWEASKRINNFDSIPLVNTMVNSAVNKAKVGSGGGKAVIDFKTAATGATQELATLFKGGVGTQAEVEEWHANAADPNKSQMQREAAIQQLAHMVGARTEALASLYSRTGRDFYSDQLNAKSKVLLKKMGIDPATFERVGAGGSSPAPPATPAAPAGGVLHWNVTTGKWE